MSQELFQFRRHVKESDLSSIRLIAESTGFFYPDEVEVAVELIQETLQKKDEYSFLFLEEKNQVLGYTCFGEIPCTSGSYDLYWIVVDKGQQGRGLGKMLIQKTEEAIKELKGRRIYIETSSRDLYRPTHFFYKACGYEIEAVLKDFYHPKDDKLIFSKKINMESDFKNH